MYKEARAIFRYDYGILHLNLKAYENLGLSKPIVIKLVSCCPSLLIGDIDPKFSGVLERFKVLGIKNDEIGGFLSGKNMYDWGTILETLNFLDRVGYTKEQLGNLVKENPALLFPGSGKKKILPKINCLKNWLGYPLESIVAFPAYLCYDMERINHRFSMYAWLRERGAAEAMLSLSTILACSDARFANYFVEVHPEGSAEGASQKKSLLSI
ncbi:hypothetical protein PTKIN_Ptkin18bG0090400 [Pterospermum kingtungense]